MGADRPAPPVRELTGDNYGRKEFTREDEYMDAYFGKEYEKGGALEVMVMSLQSVLGSNDEMFHRLLVEDRKMLELTLGLLLEYRGAYG